jgi:hypothetical protein
MTSKTEPNNIHAIIRACRLIARMIEADPGHPAKPEALLQDADSYFTRLRDAKENNVFVAAHYRLFPSEILLAMDIVRDAHRND